MINILFTVQGKKINFTKFKNILRFNSINYHMTKYYMQLLPCILMVIISHYLVLTDDQVQTIDVSELAHLVGVKVPNETVQISSWINEYKELIVEALPNNEIHIRAADSNYTGEFDFHFLSQSYFELTFSVDNYEHDLTRDETVSETCENQLVSSLGDSCRIDFFKADAIIPNIKSKHQYKQRNLFSLGWTGESVNMFHAKDGQWTKHGMDVIRAFLRCIDMPFPLKLKLEEPKVVPKALPPAKGKSQQLPSIIHRVSIQPNRQGQNNRNNERGQYKGRRQGRSRSPISPIRARSGHSEHSSSSANRRR